MNMKIILVDAVNTLISQDGKIFEEMYNLLQTFNNRKIILTNANDEQFLKFNLDKAPYEVFTLKHDPEKTNPKYFELMLKNYNLNVEDVIYFEHNIEAVNSAKSLGIKSYYYNYQEKDLEKLKVFLTENIN